MHALHLDSHLLAVDKPAGLLAVPGLSSPECLADQVQAVWPDAMVVHRLDMATSGLMLFARGADMQRRLSIAFAERRVHKRYVAIVHGEMAQDHGEVDLPLGSDWPNRPKQRVDAVGGKPSLTRWRVLARCLDTGCTRVELEPVTGRTHQLRVHLQAIGHPIVGDALYAQPPTTESRLHLHAVSLSLVHPLLGQPLALNSPAPF